MRNHFCRKSFSQQVPISVPFSLARGTTKDAPVTVSRCSVALAERRQTGGEKEAIEDQLDLMRANCQAAAVVRPA
jgi:hypothetical protein